MLQLLQHVKYVLNQIKCLYPTVLVFKDIIKIVLINNVKLVIVIVKDVKIIPLLVLVVQTAMNQLLNVVL